MSYNRRLQGIHTASALFVADEQGKRVHFIGMKRFHYECLLAAGLLCICGLLTACAAAGQPGAAATASPAHAEQRQRGATMAETNHTTEEYWGSTIGIVTEPQGDGSWKATATVQSHEAAASVAAPLRVQDQPTAEAAATAARSLAAGAIDAQRVTRGKP